MVPLKTTILGKWNSSTERLFLYQTEDNKICGVFGKTALAPEQIKGGANGTISIT